MGIISGFAAKIPRAGKAISRMGSTGYKGSIEERPRFVRDKNGNLVSLVQHGRQVFSYRASILRGNKRIRKTFHRKKEAEDWLKNGGFDPAQLNSQIDPHITLDGAFDKFLAEEVAKHKGREQEEDRIDRLKRFTFPKDKDKYPWLRFPGLKLADLRLEEIRPAHIRDFMRVREEHDGVGPQTIISDVTILSVLFNTAIKDWELEHLNNPVSKVRKPKRPEPRTRRLESEEELRRLLEACGKREFEMGDTKRQRIKGEDLRDFILLSAQNAMRRGEQLRIQFEHIDWKKATVFLPETKSHHSNPRSRTVALTPGGYAILAMRHMKAGQPETGFVFPQFDPRSWSRAFREVREIADKGTPASNPSQPKLHLHDLRRESASSFIEKYSLSLPEVQKITGHRTLSQLQVYLGLRPEDIARKMRTIDRAGEVDASNRLLGAKSHATQDGPMQPASEGADTRVASSRADSVP